MKTTFIIFDGVRLEVPLIATELPGTSVPLSFPYETFEEFSSY